MTRWQKRKIKFPPHSHNAQLTFIITSLHTRRRTCELISKRGRRKKLTNFILYVNFFWIKITLAISHSNGLIMIFSQRRELLEGTVWKTCVFASKSFCGMIWISLLCVYFILKEGEASLCVSLRALHSFLRFQLDSRAQYTCSSFPSYSRSHVFFFPLSRSVFRVSFSTSAAENGSIRQKHFGWRTKERAGSMSWEWDGSNWNCASEEWSERNRRKYVLGLLVCLAFCISTGVDLDRTVIE
jgi:hypothetical protein